MKWVPKCLNSDQKRQRCQSSEQILDFFRRDPNDFLSRSVTMDETWLYHYGPETKQQSMEWRHIGIVGKFCEKASTTYTTDCIQQQSFKNNGTKEFNLSLTPGENLDKEAHSSHTNIPKQTDSESRLSCSFPKSTRRVPCEISRQHAHWREATTNTGYTPASLQV